MLKLYFCFVINYLGPDEVHAQQIAKLELKRISQLKQDEDLRVKREAELCDEWNIKSRL